MKHCPTCQQTYLDETLQFCRVDGALLIHDSVRDESSATRILPSSQTGEAQVVHTDPVHRHTATTVLEPTKESKLQTGELRSATRAPGADSLGRVLKRHKTSAIIIAALVIAAVVVCSYFYLHSSEATIDSIAVLPFVNASGDPNTEYLSDGITESIINSLSQLPNLGVIARSSVFRYKGKDTDAPL